VICGSVSGPGSLFGAYAGHLNTHRGLRGEDDTACNPTEMVAHCALACGHRLHGAS